MADTTSTSDTVIPAEVRELIRESQKIQGWVTRLAEHVDEARPEVYQKVLADYERRLASVNESLAEHRTHLVDTVEQRRAELQSLRADRDGQAAELEEAKLRHAVGEYDDREWEKRKDRIQGALDDLDALVASEEETVDELDEIIASIGERGPELAVEGAGTAIGEALSDEATGPAARPSGTADAEAAEEASDEEAEEETAEAVVETKAGKGAPSDAGRRKAPHGEDEEGDYLDELEFLESLSLGDSDRFDAVSAMLDEEEGGKSSE